MHGFNSLTGSENPFSRTHVPDDDRTEPTLQCKRCHRWSHDLDKEGYCDECHDILRKHALKAHVEMIVTAREKLERDRAAVEHLFTQAYLYNGFKREEIEKAIAERGTKP